MPKSFLKTGEDRFLRSGFGVDHSVRMEPGQSQRRREQVAARYTPQDLTMGPRQNPGGEQGRRRSVQGAIGTAGDLMQRPPQFAA